MATPAWRLAIQPEEALPEGWQTKKKQQLLVPLLHKKLAIKKRRTVKNPQAVAAFFTKISKSHEASPKNVTGLILWILTTRKGSDCALYKPSKDFYYDGLKKTDPKRRGNKCYPSHLARSRHLRCDQHQPSQTGDNISLPGSCLLPSL